MAGTFYCTSEITFSVRRYRAPQVGQTASLRTSNSIAQDVTKRLGSVRPDHASAV
jgi:hypothetical protein